MKQTLTTIIICLLAVLLCLADSGCHLNPLSPGTLKDGVDYQYHVISKDDIEVSYYVWCNGDIIAARLGPIIESVDDLPRFKDSINRIGDNLISIAKKIK